MNEFYSDPGMLLAGFEKALFERDIAAGFRLLDAAFPAETSLQMDPGTAVPLLLCVAQWIDLGYRNLSFLNALEEAQPLVEAKDRTLADYLKTNLVKGYKLLATERLDEAQEVFALVLMVGRDALDSYLFFLANFWKGRAHRKLGEYEAAAENFSAARAAAEQAGAAKLVAVTKIHDSWLAFQNGKRQHAFDLLNQAEAELLPTGHALSLGNIESARGRFVRRSGDYAGALHHFEAAIKLYRVGCPDHPNMARALVNTAYVKRLMALDLQPREGQASGAVHEKSLRFSRDALNLLEEAERIYALHQHQSGTGSVLVNAEHIHLECGDIDRAATQARRAFDLAEDKGDQILMARAKALQSSVELARSEEQLGDEPNIGLHAHAAIDAADTAMTLALKTQNKRLLCEAYLTRGIVSASDFFQDWEQAKEYAAKAAVLLSNDDRDHLYQQLSGLKAKLAGATHIDATLRAWCDGQVGDKTFKQVQEEFAEFVIPRIWLRRGKSSSMVAKMLSISPRR